MVPAADDPHGPLPLLLLALTVVTGLVDAFSYLVLGHVFVANMTGNVVFLGFALAGAKGFSISASLLAARGVWPRGRHRRPLRHACGRASEPAARLGQRPRSAPGRGVYDGRRDGW